MGQRGGEEAGGLDQPPPIKTLAPILHPKHKMEKMNKIIN